MIKSILLGTALIAINFSVFSWTKIEKYNGGFFGYKSVAESHSGDNHMLACADPGKQNCKFAGTFGVIDQGGEEIIIDDFEPIESEVLSRITRDNTFGSFYFQSDFFIKYSYDIESDRLIIEIYSIYEATSLGLI